MSISTDILCIGLEWQQCGILLLFQRVIYQCYASVIGAWNFYLIFFTIIYIKCTAVNSGFFLQKVTCIKYEQSQRKFLLYIRRKTVFQKMSIKTETPRSLYWFYNWKCKHIFWMYKNVILRFQSFIGNIINEELSPFSMVEA